MRFDGFSANLVGPLLELERRVGDTSGMADMDDETTGIERLAAALERIATALEASKPNIWRNKITGAIMECYPGQLPDPDPGTTELYWERV